MGAVSESERSWFCTSDAFTRGQVRPTDKPGGSNKRPIGNERPFESVREYLHMPLIASSTIEVISSNQERLPMTAKSYLGKQKKSALINP
jgi:hypothetical protein